MWYDLCFKEHVACVSWENMQIFSLRLPLRKWILRLTIRYVNVRENKSDQYPDTVTRHCHWHRHKKRSVLFVNALRCTRYWPSTCTRCDVINDDYFSIHWHTYSYNPEQQLFVTYLVCNLCSLDAGQMSCNFTVVSVWMYGNVGRWVRQWP